MRIILLAAAVVALAGSASTTHSFDQRGTVATPRAATGDGQPLASGARVEVHGGAMAESMMDRADARSVADGKNAAAITRKRAGGSLRARVSDSADLGLEIDGSWSPAATTPSGAAIDAPEDAVVDVALGLRTSTRLGDSARLGFAMDLGFSSAPIVRDDTGALDRDEAVLARIALIPSVRRGAVTVFGSVGFATETAVAPTVTWTDPDTDPGVQAGASGFALAVAAGATVDVAQGTRLTARVGDAYSEAAKGGRYGAQVDVGLTFDLGK